MAIRAAVLALALAALATSPSIAETVDGQALFLSNCAACHQATGKGVPDAFPALASDRFVMGDGKTLAHVVLNGRGGMPSFGADLGDAEIAAILTYVRSAWGNKASPVTLTDVAAVRGAALPAAHQLQTH